LIDKGVSRDEAYSLVQRNATKRWIDGEDFKENILKDEDIRKYLNGVEIEDCFDYEYYLRNVDLIMKRFGL